MSYASSVRRCLVVDRDRSVGQRPDLATKAIPPVQQERRRRGRARLQHDVPPLRPVRHPAEHTPGQGAPVVAGGHRYSGLTMALTAARIAASVACHACSLDEVGDVVDVDGQGRG